MNGNRVGKLDDIQNREPVGGSSLPEGVRIPRWYAVLFEIGRKLSSGLVLESRSELHRTLSGWRRLAAFGVTLQQNPARCRTLFRARLTRRFNGLAASKDFGGPRAVYLERVVDACGAVCPLRQFMVLVRRGNSDKLGHRSPHEVVPRGPAHTRTRRISKASCSPAAFGHSCWSPLRLRPVMSESRYQNACHATGERVSVCARVCASVSVLLLQAPSPDTEGSRGQSWQCRAAAPWDD